MWRILVAVALVLYMLGSSRSQPPSARMRSFPQARHGGKHVAAATEAGREFERAYVLTFRETEDPQGAVRKLFAARASVLKEMNELRMRLPNDLELETQFVETAEAVDRDLLERIEDARQRLGAPLVHPGPVDDAWYGQWYRAANDVLV